MEENDRNHSESPAVLGQAARDLDTLNATPSPSTIRLAKNWYRRAAVKRGDFDPDQAFDMNRPDYPLRVLPFQNHPVWQNALSSTRSRILSWAWIAYNRRTITGEQQLANPAFELILENAYPGVANFSTCRAVGQAIVDEQYHIFMHRQASDITRSRRQLALPDALLPETHTNLAHQRMREACSDRWQRDLITLAFATVSEVSISAYLGLIAHDPDVQPMNSSMVRTHLRDEYCHAEICSDVAKAVYEHLKQEEKGFFLRTIAHALDSFVSTDFTIWETIFDYEDFPGRHELLGDIRQGQATRRLLRDYSGIYSFLTELGALNMIDFDWGKSEVRPQKPIVDNASKSDLPVDSVQFRSNGNWPGN